MDLSVICPLHDTPPRLLLAALASVRACCDEAGQDYEILLVDDASTAPATLACLDSIRDPAVRLLRNPVQEGPAGARNRGLAAATGEWVGFIDADDLWLPGRQRLAASLMARPDVDWIGGRHLLREPGGDSPARGLAEALGLAPDAVAGGAALTRCLIANFWMHLGATLVRRGLAQRLGGFAPGLSYYEDFLFMARLSRSAPLHRLDADLYAWRREGGGLTAAPGRLRRSSLRMYALAGADPLLRPFHRELRWARYSALKGLAANNRLSGARGRALALALEAWATDPREWRTFALMARLCLAPDSALHGRLRRYSQAEFFGGAA